MQDHDLNMIVAFEFCNQPSFGERTEEPFVASQANDRGRLSFAAELQRNQNRQDREHHSSDERSNHVHFLFFSEAGARPQKAFLCGYFLIEFPENQRNLTGVSPSLMF